MAQRKILIVDDEPHIVEFLAMNLRQNGYTHCFSSDGETAIEMARIEQPDLILLDSMLPGISGVETCRILKQNAVTADIPVIFLSAKSEETDKVLGLAIGADDYMTKPFSIRELFARIEAVLRRSVKSQAFYGGYAADGGLAYGAGAMQSILRFQDLQIDLSAHNVEKAGAKIALSPAEFSILALVAGAQGKVVPRAVIIERLGLSGGDEDARSLDVHIRNLRKKLGTAINSAGYLETVRGIGYKINE